MLTDVRWTQEILVMMYISDLWIIMIIKIVRYNKLIITMPLSLSNFFKKKLFCSIGYRTGFLKTCPVLYGTRQVF